jgi:cation:H+ antiporter
MVRSRLPDPWRCEAIIGLTVVAIGTSASELVTTLVSTARGDRDIAIGNLLGSSVYNIALILGITILVAPSELEIPPEVIAADLLLLAVVAVITVPVLLSGQRMTRGEGGAFVAAYVGYLLWLILAKSNPITLRATDRTPLTSLVRGHEGLC